MCEKYKEAQEINLDKTTYVIKKELQEGNSKIAHVFLVKPKDGKGAYVYKCYPSEKDNAYKREKMAYDQLFPNETSQQTVYAIPKLLWHDDESRGILLEYFPSSLEERFTSLREYASGGDRSQLDQEILKLSFHMAAALKSLHDQEIYHLDINPWNIRYKDEQYWLIDLGWAYIPGKMPGPSTNKQNIYAEANYPEYRAPGLTPSRKSPDFQFDIYSLGCVLYYVYKGKDYNSKEQSRKKNKVARSMEDFKKENFPPWLANLLAEMLAPFKQRIKDGNALRDRLPKLLGDEANWLLNDDQWMTLSEHYDRSIAMHRTPSRYRLGRGVLRGFAVSADGAILAVITSTGLWLRDIKNNQLIKYEEALSLPLALSWEQKRTSSLLAIMYANKSVHIWQYKKDDGNKKTVRKLVTLPSLPSALLSLAWGGQNEPWLAVGTVDGNIYIWNIVINDSDPDSDSSASYEQVDHITTKAGGIRALSWLPKKDVLVLGGESGALCIWNEKEQGSQKPPKVLGRFDSTITGIISLDRKRIVFTTAKGIIRQYDIGIGEVTEFPERHSGNIHDILLLKNIRMESKQRIIFATAGADGRVNIWDISSGKTEDDANKVTPVILPQHSSRHPISLAVIDNETSLSLLTGSVEQGAIYQYRYILPEPDRTLKLRSLKLFDLSVTTLVWVGDYSEDHPYQLVTGNVAGVVEKYVIGSITAPGFLQNIEPFAIDIRVLKEDAVSFHPHAVRKIITVPNKSEVAVVCTDFSINIWDYEQQSVKNARINSDATGAIAWHPLSNMMAYATEGAGIAFYLPLARIVCNQLKSTGGYIHKLMFNHDGTQLAAVSNTFSLRLIDLERFEDDYFIPRGDGKLYQYYPSVITALAWLPCSEEWLLANRAGKIWTAKEDGAFAILIQGNQKAHVVHFVVWSNKDNSCNNWKLAVAYSDRRIEIWNFQKDADLKTALKKRENVALLPSGHTERITDISFSPDGRWLASSSVDGSVVIYPLVDKKGVINE